MGYLEQLSDEQAFQLKSGARQVLEQYGYCFTDLELAVDNLADFMAHALIFEGVLLTQDLGK